MEAFITGAGTLAAAVLVLFLAWWGTKKFASGSAFKYQSRYMKILDRIAVAQDKSVILIEAGGKVYMAGVGPGGITLLSEIEKDSLTPVQPQTAVSVKEISFGEIFRKIGGKKKDGQ